MLIVVLAMLLAAGFLFAQAAKQAATHLTMDMVMTGQELQNTGVAGLGTSQRKALDDWLNRYTGRVIKALVPSGTRSDCTPAIEDQIDGDFEGWDGETIFKLTNGQIWEQTEYDYEYEYAYNPDVTIYSTTQGCRMKVEGMDDTIIVRRVK